MKPNSFDIAERFSRLALDKQRVFLASIRSKGVDFGKLPIVRRPDEDTSAVASYAQVRQWFLWQLDKSSTAYHISGALRLRGPLDVQAVRNSFEALVRRHESLRTSFRQSEEGVIEQHIHPETVLDLEEVDVSGRAESGDREAGARMVAERLQQTPFDLERGPLLRVGLIREGAESHVLVVVMHHIISDGWSMQVIVDEFVAEYRARVAGQEAVLASLPIQYADYAVWQRNWMEAGEKDRQLAYWKEQLGTEHPVLQLPTDHARRPDAQYQAAHHEFELKEGLVSSLKQLASGNGSTLFMTLLTAAQMLLHRYTGQTDIRVGVPVANRHRVETAGVVGFFVNTQVLRTVIDGRDSLGAVLDSVKASVLGAQAHQDLPFEQLVEALQPERSLGLNPFFQVMVNHQRQDHRGLQSLPNLAIEDYPLGEQGAQFELTIDTREDDEGRVHVSIGYARELFEPATIERMGSHYRALLRALSEDLNRCLGSVELLSLEEQEILNRWGVNEANYLDMEPVHRLFETRVRASPEAAALIFEGEALSYQQLNERANQLAHHLIELGVGPEVRVGIAVERSIGMVVALLAILKAGGAYVPLDPEYPPERLRYMIEDSGIGLLLTHTSVPRKLPELGLETVPVPSIRPAGNHGAPNGPGAPPLQVLDLDAVDVSQYPVSNPDVAVHGENLAYVIYTSGSTGRPKGTAIRHQALSRCMQWMQQKYQLGSEDTVLHKAPFCFDVSVWEIFWPLTAGVRLVVASPGDHRDPARITELIRRHQVTTLNFVPAMLQAFLAHEGIERETRLRYVICGGEAMPAGTQREALQRLDGVSLQNLYGPTETTIHVTQWQCRDDGKALVPIGRPISATSAHVLDEMLQPVPAGVAGELYIGGDLLARGYLGRQALSAERFLADPFSKEGSRLYRTGDLVRWNAEGQLEYLGRIDHQVKIRGFRIELGEVEAQLLAQPEVREAVVVADEVPGGARLVGYVSAHAESLIDASILRERLAASLPDYMVPSAIMVLDALPLNANGKVDRRALPEPAFDTSEAYEPPQGEIEEKLAAIWSEVLGVERVSRQDNFFDLGGTSLSALKLISILEKKMPFLGESLKSFYKNPFIRREFRDEFEACKFIHFSRGVNSSRCFVLPDGWGSVIDFTEMARFLGQRGIELIGLSLSVSDTKTPYASLDELAAYFAREIMNIDTSNSFRLMGWSLGGALAPMVAEEISRSGGKVRSIILLDPFVPKKISSNSRARRFRSLRNDLAEFLSYLVPDNLMDDPVLKEYKELIRYFQGNRKEAIKIIFEIFDFIKSNPRSIYSSLSRKDLKDLFDVSSFINNSSFALRDKYLNKSSSLVIWSKERRAEDRDSFMRLFDFSEVCSCEVDFNHMEMVRSICTFERIESFLFKS